MAEEGNLDQGTGADDAAAIAAAAKAAEGGGEEGPEAKAAAEAKALTDAQALVDAAKPTEYQTFEMPEGMEIDKTALEAFTPLLRSGKVSQEDAQKYVDIFADAAKRNNDAHTKMWNEAVGKWQEDAKADSEIGGDKWSETETHVALALKLLSPPNSKDEQGNDTGTNPLEAIFKLTGMGNHVEMARLLGKMGKILSDDKIDLGHALGQVTKTGAEVMYPNQGK